MSDRSDWRREFYRGPGTITERAQAAARKGIARARAALAGPIDTPNEPDEDET